MLTLRMNGFFTFAMSAPLAKPSELKVTNFLTLTDYVRRDIFLQNSKQRYLYEAQSAN